MKKVLSFVLTLCLIVPCMFLFSACGKNNGETRVMNVSVNPFVEFVIDENDKVVTVSASNDDGNFIVANAEFVGLSAEEAVELFLQVAKDNGFVIDTSNNTLTIEISGNNAEDLFDKVKKKANEYLSSVNININIEFNKIDKEALKDLVKECMQELTASEVNALSEKELIDLIKTSRKETKNLYSQELKEFYYSARADEIFSAKLDEISRLIAESTTISDTLKEQFQNAFSQFELLLEQFNALYEEIYFSSKSEYQVALQEYINAKQALLEARLNDEVDLTALEQAVVEAKTALDSAKASAESSLATIKSSMDSARNTLNELINLIANTLHHSDFSNAINNAKDKFNQDFNNNFGDYINNNYWNDLKPSEKE